VLFYGAGADIELARNLFVAATLHEQVQDLLVAGSDFHLIQVDHVVLQPTQRSHSYIPIARLSPILRTRSVAAAKYFGV